MIIDPEQFEACLNKLDELNKRIQVKTDAGQEVGTKELLEYDILTQRMESLIIKDNEEEKEENEEV